MNATEIENLVLGGLALFLTAIGAVAWWLSAHPAKTRAFIYGVRHHPTVIRAEKRYRDQIEFLVRRFQPEGAFGLSYTLGLITLAASAWLFGSVLQDVLAQEELALFDVPVMSYIASRRVDWLVTCMLGVTYLGSGKFLLAVVIAVGLALRYRTGSWRALLLLVCVAIGAMTLDVIVKFAIACSRPPAEWMISPASGWAFPASHSTQATAVYGAVAYLIAETQAAWRAKVRLLAFAGAGAFLIGVSQIYLGLHWPTDVISGWALGVAWLALVFTTTYTIGKIHRITPATSSLGAASFPIATSGPEQSERESFSRFTDKKRPRTDLDGLSETEVQDRVARGEVNTSTLRTSRSFAEILRANIFTRVNGLLGSLFLVILWVGPFQDTMFAIILVANTMIGIVQELRAKRTLDRLVLASAPMVRVVRAGVPRELRTENIVLDEVVELRPGDQVPVDGLVLVANGLEVDESLLTGESEPVAKQLGDEILSGSFVVAGNGRMQATRIGSDSYARTLAAKARKFTLARSELRDGINRILGYVTWLLVPTAILLIDTQLLDAQTEWRDAVTSSAGAVVGMVPEGFILLTSVALAVAVIRLGQRRVLVQELPAVELLARVDVLCLDKTGTLTDGQITFERLVHASEFCGSSVADSIEDLREVLAALAGLEPNPNASLAAIATACQLPVNSRWEATATVPFSSARKWSAATFASRGTWVLGAPEILLTHVDDSTMIREEVERMASTGRRVLGLGYTPEPLGSVAEPALPNDLTPAALLVFAERIRSDATVTLRYFAEQGVALKVISGDNPRTVAVIATAAGVTGAGTPVEGAQLAIDPESIGEMMEHHNIFGRVAPHQKRDMISALKHRGHVVAMVGDGINDILALKDADLGIAMGTRTAATRAVAQVVLLDDSFAALPSIIAEGRRVIANIERTGNLFLAKTSYVLLMALAVGVAGVEFPFLPRHLSIVAALTIGVPAFFLALAPNTTRARPGFVLRVLRFSIPSGCIASGATLAAYAFTRQLHPGNLDLARTAATLTLSASGLSILTFLARASTPWQRLLLAAMLAALGIVVALPKLRAFFGLEFPPFNVWLTIVALAIATYMAFGHLTRMYSNPAPR